MLFDGFCCHVCCMSLLSWCTPILSRLFHFLPAAIDAARLGDSLQFLLISSKNLAWIPNHKHLHWVQSTKLYISATTCIEISKFWSVDLYEVASECTSVCPEFLGICQKHFHSASEAMSKYLLARPTYFYKVPENNAFPGRKYAPPCHTTYKILIDHQLACSTLIS